MAGGGCPDLCSPGKREGLAGVCFLLGALPSGHWCISPSPQMESPVSTPAVLPLHLLVPVVNNDISSPCEQIMVRTRSVGVNTCDVALATEPECLGPCEPGTSVNLEGIVWQETEDGKCLWRACLSSSTAGLLFVIPLYSLPGVHAAPSPTLPFQA